MCLVVETRLGSWKKEGGRYKAVKEKSVRVCLVSLVIDAIQERVKKKKSCHSNQEQSNNYHQFVKREEGEEMKK